MSEKNIKGKNVKYMGTAVNIIVMTIKSNKHVTKTHKKGYRQSTLAKIKDKTTNIYSSIIT